MKMHFWHLILICAAASFVACASGRKAFTNAPDTTNSQGVVTPGISPATDALLTAKTVNLAANPTATRTPVDIILGALVIVSGAVGGWFARHATQRRTATAEAAVIPRRPRKRVEELKPEQGPN